MNKWVSRTGVSSIYNPQTQFILPSHLNHLLRLCSNSKALKQLHNQIITNGFTPNPFIFTKLIQIYADCNDFISAHALFDQLSQPNVFAWTAMLSYYSRNGLHKKCLDAYAEMQEMGIAPDRYVFPKVIRACAQSLSFIDGICVHKDVIKYGAQGNVQVCNALIDMYSKCGDFGMAKKIFNEMGVKDLVTWNTMISGCIFNGFLELGVEYLGRMRLEGFEPDLVSWNMIMDAYCRMGQCEEASRVFEFIRKPNIISCTTLISGYSRLGKNNMALWYFRNMIWRGGVFPDSDALSNIVVSCRLLGARLNGREIHGYGIKTQKLSEFYNSAGAALIAMYARFGRAQCAKNVFEFMDKSDVVIWNAMILAYVHLGMVDLAFSSFVEMQFRGLESDETTISIVLPTCDLKYGKQIHAHMRRKGFDYNILVWNALVNMYAKNGCIGDSFTVFERMRNRDIVSWNTMIGGYGMHGNGSAALQLLQEMCRVGFQPNSVTFTSVLAACSHSGLVNEGLELFHSLSQQYGISPTMEQYACIVDMLARSGKLEDAVHFINRMPIKPDKSIWGAVLAACRAHQNVGIGKLAAEHLFYLEPENAGNYVTLSNLYAGAGRRTDAIAVRKLMESRRLLKPSGQSWVHGQD